MKSAVKDKSCESLKNITDRACKQVAVIGAGYWGKNLVRNFHDIGALNTICDVDKDSRARFQEQYPECRVSGSYQDILGDDRVDAVVIATPVETHADLVRRAIEAGKDVFVEKPLCLSASEGEGLIKLARQKNRILMVGHLLWYHPAVLKLKELVEQGELGRIQYVYSNRLSFGKIRREENILWSFAPHDISVILGLLGEMPDHVQAHGGNYLHKQLFDVTVSCLSFPSGVKAHIFVSWLHPFKEQKLVVVGERKMAVFNDCEQEKKLLIYPHSIEWQGNIPVLNPKEAEPVPLNKSEPLRIECEHFLECVDKRIEPRTDGEEALRVLKVLRACQSELEKGRRLPAAGNAAIATPGFKDVVIHPTAVVDEGVTIGEGTRIWHFSHIMPGTKIGRKCVLGQNVSAGPSVTIGNNVKVQNNVSIYKGVEIEDDVFCGPSMVFTNVINPRSAIERKSEFRLTKVGKGATLGANCTIVCGYAIGRHSFVGAGAVVTREVPDHALVVGSPARVVGWVCSCAKKLVFTKDKKSGKETAKCNDCGRRYEKDGDAAKETEKN
ncbi:Gfo/Idh/MocA family oxidoreductase [Elusimicrobiota bacterium]